MTVPATESELPPAHRRALAAIDERFAASELEWAVSGSAALALHGLTTRCNDLDLLLSEAGALQAGALLADELEQPVALRARDGFRGVIGRARVAGVTVELLGDVRNELPDGSFTDPPDVAAGRVWIELDGRSYPVVSRAALADAYRALGRHDRVELLQGAI